MSESAKACGKYRLLRITDIQNNNVQWNNVPYTDFDSNKAESYLLNDGDILFARTGATVGKSYLVQGLTEKAIYASYLIRVQTYNAVLPQYIKFYFESGYYWEQIEQESVGVGQPNVNGSILGNLQIPIPPIHEQNRIVLELTRWKDIIDAIEDGTIELESYVKQTKSKILDLAISGKLVPQDPNDEPAIEILRRINPGFKPCDNSHYENLPQGWAVCRLEDVCQIRDNQRQPINSTERQERKKRAQTLYPYYGATGQVDWIDDYMLDGTFILLGEDGAPFLDKFADKAYVVRGKIWVNNHAHILKPNCDITYLTYYLNRYDYSECVNGSTRLKLTQADMKNMTIVLPPLVEQHRIAGRTENIFRMLDAITAEL